MKTKMIVNTLKKTKEVKKNDPKKVPNSRLTNSEKGVILRPKSSVDQQLSLA